MKPFDLVECIKNGGHAVDKSGCNYRLVDINIITKSLKFMRKGEHTFYYYLDGRLNCQEIISEDRTLYLPEPSDEYEPFDLQKYMAGGYTVVTRGGKRVGTIHINPGPQPLECVVDGKTMSYSINGYYIDRNPTLSDLMLVKK